MIAVFFNRKKSLHLLTVPSPILLMTHGIRAVDPVWAVTTLLFSVAKCTGGPSKGGNEAPSSFRPSPPSARSRSTESAKLPFLTVNRHNLLTRSTLSYQFLWMKFEFTLFFQQTLCPLCMNYSVFYCTIKCNLLPFCYTGAGLVFDVRNIFAEQPLIYVTFNRVMLYSACLNLQRNSCDL